MVAEGQIKAPTDLPLWKTFPVLINELRGLDIWSVAVRSKISAHERDRPDNRHVNRPLMIELSFLLQETHKKIFG